MSDYRVVEQTNGKGRSRWMVEKLGWYLGFREWQELRAFRSERRAKRWVEKQEKAEWHDLPGENE